MSDLTIKIKKYSNGAELIYRKRKRKHTSVRAGFIFGKNRDKYAEPVAHFCEHLYMEENQNYSKKELKEKITNTFTRFNATTSIFATSIQFMRANKVIESCFELAGKMLTEPSFPKETVELEKGVIKQELVSVLNKTSEKMATAMRRTVSTKYNRNEMILGNVEEIDAVTPEDLINFKNDVFITQNFVIAIEGGISYFKAKKYAEKYFINKIKSKPEYPVDKTYITPYDRKGNLNIEQYEFKKTICSILFRLDKELEDDKTFQNLKMLSRLCNNISGVLFAACRESGLVYNIYMACNNAIKNKFSISIQWECSSDNVNKVIDKLGEILKKLRNDLIDQDLIELEKKNSKLALDELIPGSIYPTMLFGDYLTYGVEVFSKKRGKCARKFFKKIKSEDILKLCKNIFSKPKNIYVAILTDEAPDKFYNYKKIQKILTTD